MLFVMTSVECCGIVFRDMVGYKKGVTLAARANIEKRRDEVMELAVSGVASREIARRMGVSNKTIGKDIRSRLKAAAEGCPSTARYRQMHRQRIGELLSAWWETAKVDVFVLDRVIRLLEREAKLLGLDKPAGLVETGDDTLPEITVRYVMPDNVDPMAYARKIDAVEVEAVEVKEGALALPAAPADAIDAGVAETPSFRSNLSDFERFLAESDADGVAGAGAQPAENGPENGSEVGVE